MADAALWIGKEMMEFGADSAFVEEAIPLKICSKGIISTALQEVYALCFYLLAWGWDRAVHIGRGIVRRYNG